MNSMKYTHLLLFPSKYDVNNQLFRFKTCKK